MKHRKKRPCISVFRLADTPELTDIRSTSCLGSKLYSRASFLCRISIILSTTLFQPVALRGALLGNFFPRWNMSLMEVTIFFDFR